MSVAAGFSSSSQLNYPAIVVCWLNAESCNTNHCFIQIKEGVGFCMNHVTIAMCLFQSVGLCRRLFV